MEIAVNQTKPSAITRIGKRIIFSVLNSLKNASLTVYDQNDVFNFGDQSSELKATIHVHDQNFYSRILTGGSIGASESYVHQEWDSDDLMSVVKLFTRNQDAMLQLENRLSFLRYPANKLEHWFNRNTRSGSKENIAAHYDIGNVLYKLMLDPHMQYSSAIFSPHHTTLDQAQENKLRTICEKLELNPSDHVVEIGAGWGGLACYMAKNYGCKVTTTTLSKEQFDYAQNAVKSQGLEDKVTLLLKDYRDLEGQFDKLVSIEMIEAVGHQFFPSYFNKLGELVKPDGRLLIQAITIADQHFESYKKGVDFIQKYIFPGGCLPSLSEMCRHLTKETDMTVSSINEYGVDYARTLACWEEKFTKVENTLNDMGYDEQFRRLWHFYFAYCEGAFREGYINVIHFEAVKPGARQCPGFGLN